MRKIVKIVLLALVLAIFIAGCYYPGPIRVTSTGEDLPKGVSKFQDGNVMCYLYLNGGISCLRMESGK